MVAKEDIICFSSIDWEFVWQGHQQIMQTLASQGHRVLYIENTGVRPPKIDDLGRLKQRIRNFRKGVYGIRRLNSNLYIYSPLLLPFPYSRLALVLNSMIFWNSLRRWLKTLSFHKPIVWTFLPTKLTQKMIQKIDPKLLIYYCIDNFSESSKGAQKIKKDEINLLREADLVFATSHRLIEHCSKYHPDVSFFPFGVDLTHYLGKTFHSPPKDLAPIPSPRVGYIGGIHQWIDFQLIKELLVKLPNIHFVFIGPIQTDVSRLKEFKNIYFVPQKPQAELPYYIYYFDLCLIPYRITPYTQSVYPTKLNEYLAMGKKVISTPIQEIVMFNEKHRHPVTVARTAEEFVKAIQATLKKSESGEIFPGERKAESVGRYFPEGASATLPAHEGNISAHTLDMRGGNMSPPSSTTFPEYIEIAKTNSWDRRIESMLSLIHQKITQKHEIVEKDWSYRIKTLYQAMTRKIVIASLFLILGYVILFYSKLPYYVAQPLKIEDRLVPADAVLALGGGAGESGLVGQGYLERVKTAVNLYQKGFVKKIVFSSSYSYLMKESEVMKNLAIAMGIPEKDIFIENLGWNTYESIKYFARYAQKREIKSVIIVSSPYHMKRTQLVAKKNLPIDLSFQLKPVEDNLFFNSFGRQSRFGQLKAIAHEYVAIAYYKLKKFI